MRARDIMSRPVVSVDTRSTVREAVTALTEHGFAAVPVVEEGLLVGMVARRDLLRTMVRTDDVVAANVRGLLDRYAGSRRHWEVEVVDGRVAVQGDFADEAEKAVVAALARTVSGVLAVALTATAPAGLGWDD